MVCACFYDENDNFNDKRFILTSYNKAVKIEDKIRKSSTIFDGPNSSNNMDSAKQIPIGEWQKQWQPHIPPPI